MGYTNFNFKAVTLAFALALLSACSSSQVDDADSVAPVETADSADLAPTDSVPPAPDALPLDASAGPVVEDPNLASQAPMPPIEQPAATAPAPSMDIVSSEQAPQSADANIHVPALPLDPSMSSPADDQSTERKHSKKRKKRRHSENRNQVAAAQGGDVSQYRVRKGDTLMKIAFENYGDLYRWREIYEANRDVISDPNHVPPGTRLQLSGAGMVQIEKNGERYKIKHGDTLGTISNDVYGTPTKWKRLWENNRTLIKDPNKIYAGFYLYYQPEHRLTREQEAPASAVEEGPDAAKMKAPVAPHVQPVAPVAPGQPEQRTPASK